MDDVPEADVLPRKRLCLTAPALRFEVGESSVAAAARQPRLDVTHATYYSFFDTMDATPGHPMSREVGYVITDFGMAWILMRCMLLESEARHARQAWSHAMDYNRAVHAELLAYRAEGHDRTREPERARDPDPQDRPADAGSSSILYGMLSIMGDSHLALP
ncbi:hypothetical protein Tco_1339040 [Tanacetum coccineum]